MFGFNQINVKIEDLQFYFDSQEKNVIDSGRFGYKAGIALSLRHKLLNLDEKEFDIAVNAIDRIISPHYRGDRYEDRKKKLNSKHQDGQQLFSATSGGSSGDEVSRI